MVAPSRASFDGADPWAGAPEEPEALNGWLAQDRVASFEARRTRAQARLAAIEAYRQGEGPLGTAMPDLPPERLHEVALVEARLRALDRRGEARAIASSRRVPGAPDSPESSSASDALQAALAAEGAADRAERELLLAMRAWLRERPELTARSLTIVLAPWEQRIERMRSVDPDDPASAPLLQEGLAAQEALQRLKAALGELRDHRLVGRPLPEPDAARLAEAREDEAAALALAWQADALPEPAEKAVNEAVDALVSRQVERLHGSLDGVMEEDRLPVPVAEKVVAREEARTEVLPQLLRPLGDARVELADARLVRAESAALATADAEATRREAEVARETSVGLSAEQTAQLIEARLPAEARVEDLALEVAAERDAAAAQRADAAEVLTAARQARSTMRETGVPPDNLDEVYGKLRDRITILRDQAKLADQHASTASGAKRDALEVQSAERARISAERRALVDLDTPVLVEQRARALDRWAEVLGEERTLLDERVQIASESRDAALRQLSDAAELRRALAPSVSAEEARLDQDVLFREFVDELSVVGPAYLATLRQRATSAAEDPWSFLRMGVLRDLAASALWLIGAVVLWLLARRYANSLIDAAMRQLAAQSAQVRSIDLEPLRDPLHRLLVTTVDVIAAWMLLGMVPDGLPELSVLLLLIFEVQLIRLLLAAYDIVFDRIDSLRPALVRLSAGAWTLGRRSVLALGLWLSTFRVLHVFVEDVIAGFATAVLVNLLRLVVLVVLIVVLLYLWAPYVRGRMARHPRKTALTQLLGTKPPTVLLAGPQALVGVAFLTIVFLRDLVFRVARIGFVARWFATFDRLRLGRNGEEAASDLKPIPVGIRTELTTGVSARAFIDRPKARKRLVDEVLAWKDGKRQGLLALLGDTGDGRGAAITHWKGDWEEQGLPTLQVGLHHRLATRRDALVWVARAFDLSEVPDDEEAAIAALSARLDPGVVVVTGLHLAFLRTVGGFDALRTLFEVFHADPQRCWILVFYRPAWRYLERLGTALNIHLVQEVVDLTPLGGAELREMTTTLAQQAGFELDFSGLVSTGALAGDPEVELQRGIDGYYRLLATASAGNPAVALDLWSGCLAVPDGVTHAPIVPAEEGEEPQSLPPAGDPSRRLVVRVTPEVRSTPVADLGDDQLFVLAAVRVQGELDEAELAEVLNMGRAQVRALVRQLVGAGLLLRSERGVYLSRHHMPSTTLTLRRRHFLHGVAG